MPEHRCEALRGSKYFYHFLFLWKETKEILAGPEVLTRGFIFVRDNINLIKDAEKIATDVILEHTKSNYVDFSKVKLGIRDKVGKYFYEKTECKPMILIVIGEV